MLDPDVLETQMDLLPHEFFHSWNGKYRRPAGLATPNYQEPMKGDLLWIYEGLTQYYGVMLAARSGVWKPDDCANIGGHLCDFKRTARKNLARPGGHGDFGATVCTARPAGASWRRGVDYYDESELLWLEADTLIREKTGGKKSLDDFCGNFMEEKERVKVLPYTLEDVVAAMNSIAANEWKKFFEDRIHSHGPGAPLGGIENSGWKSCIAKSSTNMRSEEEADHVIDMEFSFGFSVHGPGGEDADGC